MNRQVLIGEVAEENCTSTIVGELMSAGTTDAKGRVGAFRIDESTALWSWKIIEADR